MKDSNALLKKFIEAALKTGTTLEIIPNDPESVKAAVEKLIANSPNNVAANLDILNQLTDDYFSGSGFESTLNLEKLERADTSISYAFAGIARTGSIAINLDSDYGGYVSLLPSKHTALLDIKNIVERPRDIFKQGLTVTADKHEGIVIITGPSATADMGELVKGAHGPAQLHLILLDEESAND